MKNLTKNNMKSTSKRALTTGAVLLLLVSMGEAKFKGTYSPEDKILGKAFTAFMDGRDKVALGYFEEVIRLNPTNSAAHKGIDKVQERMNKKKKAKFVRARHLARAKVKEANALLKSNDGVGAIDALHEALDAVPDYKSALKRMRSIRRRNEKILKRDDVKPSDWSFARGILAYMDRDWAWAYRIWSERKAIEPENASLVNATVRAEKNFVAMMNAEREVFFRRSAQEFYERGLYQESLKAWDRVLAYTEVLKNWM